MFNVGDLPKVDGELVSLLARLGLARTYQVTQVFPQLPVIENVLIAVQGQARGRLVGARQLLFAFLQHADGLVRATEREIRRGPSVVVRRCRFG